MGGWICGLGLTLHSKQKRHLDWLLLTLFKMGGWNCDWALHSTPHKKDIFIGCFSYSPIPHKWRALWVGSWFSAILGTFFLPEYVCTYLKELPASMADGGRERYDDWSWSRLKHTIICDWHMCVSCRPVSRMASFISFGSDCHFPSESMVLAPPPIFFLQKKKKKIVEETIALHSAPSSGQMLFRLPHIYPIGIF